ncbi:hypothetical protein ONJ23_27320, partial [Salmonella enterica subsp. enterica serovar Virginia]|nr:hypothetical protein [Salmonella enterica subsp. enterica serovar Virginia]
MKRERAEIVLHLQYQRGFYLAIRRDIHQLLRQHAGLELFEEVGLSRKDVRILASTRNWLRYKLPKRLVRWDTKPVCIG